MEWTKDKPKEEGFYWMRRPGRIKVAYVFHYSLSGTSYLAIPDRFGDIEIPDDWEWAGPIPEPGEN